MACGVWCPAVQHRGWLMKLRRCSRLRRKRCRFRLQSETIAIRFIARSCSLRLPARTILPALRASEKAMPNNYVASLRLAQIEVAAKQYDQAIATCHRGLTRTPGAFGKTWLLEIEAEALEKKGLMGEARQLLQEALTSAEQIPSGNSRERVVAAIKKTLESSSPQPK